MTHNLVVLRSLLKNEIFFIFAELIDGREVLLNVGVRQIRFKLMILLKKFLQLFEDIWKVWVFHDCLFVFLAPGRHSLFIIVPVGSFDVAGDTNGVYANDRDIDVLYEQAGDVSLLEWL